jgi:hypothetical protein
MMHDNAIVNLIPLKPEIASKVSRDHLVASISPNITLVKTLVHPPRTAECLSEKCTIKREVLETLFECA